MNVVTNLVTHWLQACECVRLWTVIIGMSKDNPIEVAGKDGSKTNLHRAPQDRQVALCLWTDGTNSGRSPRSGRPGCHSSRKKCWISDWIVSRSRENINPRYPIVLYIAGRTKSENGFARKRNNAEVLSPARKHQQL
jgi:hypothetical protein